MGSALRFRYSHAQQARIEFRASTEQPDPGEGCTKAARPNVERQVIKAIFVADDMMFDFARGSRNAFVFAIVGAPLLCSALAVPSET